MTRDERLLWWELTVAVAACVLVAWLIGAPAFSTADIVRDRIFLGLGR